MIAPFDLILDRIGIPFHFPDFPSRIRRYHANEISRVYAIMRSPFHIFPRAFMRTGRHQPSAQYLGACTLLCYGLCARDHTFYAQTPNTALVSPRQARRPGIHSAAPNHDFLLRSWLFKSRRVKMWADQKQDPIG